MADTFDFFTWAARHPGAVAALAQSHPAALEEMRGTAHKKRKAEAKEDAREVEVEMKAHEPAARMVAMGAAEHAARAASAMVARSHPSIEPLRVAIEYRDSVTNYSYELHHE